MSEEYLKYALIIHRALVRNESEVETVSDVGDLMRVYRNMSL